VYALVYVLGREWLISVGALRVDGTAGEVPLHQIGADAHEPLKASSIPGVKFDAPSLSDSIKLVIKRGVDHFIRHDTEASGTVLVYHVRDHDFAARERVITRDEFALENPLLCRLFNAR
jgi:hypothetical protein